MASAGQVSTQTPQSTQLSALTCALPPTMLIALLGHSLTQDSHPVHFSLLTSAGIQQPFQITITSMYRESNIIAKSHVNTTPNSLSCCKNASNWLGLRCGSCRVVLDLGMPNDRSIQWIEGDHGRTIGISSDAEFRGKAEAVPAWSDLARLRTNSSVSCFATQSKTGWMLSVELLASR